MEPCTTTALVPTQPIASNNARSFCIVISCRKSRVRFANTRKETRAPRRAHGLCAPRDLPGPDTRIRVRSNFLFLPGSLGRRSWRLVPPLLCGTISRSLGHNLAATQIASLPCDKEDSRGSLFLHSSYMLLTRSRRQPANGGGFPMLGRLRRCGVDNVMAGSNEGNFDVRIARHQGGCAWIRSVPSDLSRQQRLSTGVRTPPVF